MGNKLSLISYALATAASVCFIGGLVILSGEGENHGWKESRKHYLC